MFYCHVEHVVYSERPLTKMHDFDSERKGLGYGGHRERGWRRAVVTGDRSEVSRLRKAVKRALGLDPGELGSGPAPPKLPGGLGESFPSSEPHRHHRSVFERRLN